MCPYLNRSIIHICNMCSFITSVSLLHQCYLNKQQATIQITYQLQFHSQIPNSNNHI